MFLEDTPEELSFSHHLGPLAAFTGCMVTEARTLEVTTHKKGIGKTSD